MTLKSSQSQPVDVTHRHDSTNLERVLAGGQRDGPWNRRPDDFSLEDRHLTTSPFEDSTPMRRLEARRLRTPLQHSRRAGGSRAGGGGCAARRLENAPPPGAGPGALSVGSMFVGLRNSSRAACFTLRVVARVPGPCWLVCVVVVGRRVRTRGTRCRRVVAR